VVKTTVLAVKTINVTGFLEARRIQAPPPSIPRVEEVTTFLANEPVLAAPVNIMGLVEEPLQAPEGSIPSVLNHPLGSNIQHILEDIDVESEDSVGMADDNMGLRTVAAAQTSRQLLSTILEQGASSRASTLKRPQSLILDEVDRASISKRPRAFGVPKA
jgi:hypothetical protein